MSPAFKEKFKKAWPEIKLRLIEWLKGKAVSLAIKKILGTAAMGGFKVWLIKFVVENLFEEVAEPVAKAVLIKGEWLYHRVEAEVIVSKLERADREHDEQAHNDSIDDILS